MFRAFHALLDFEIKLSVRDNEEGKFSSLHNKKNVEKNWLISLVGLALESAEGLAGGFVKLASPWLISRRDSRANK